MSKPGDVVWADGIAWQRDHDGHLSWYSPFRYNPLSTKHLKAFKDFKWLVKNGELVSNGDLVVVDEITYTPLQQAMIDELSEFIDPVSMNCHGTDGINVGARTVVGCVIADNWDGQRLNVRIQYDFYPGGCVYGRTDAKTASEWLGAG